MGIAPHYREFHWASKVHRLDGFELSIVQQSRLNRTIFEAK